MESFVFQKELLEKDDLIRYYKLTDKHNSEEIEIAIEECKEKLDAVLKGKEYFTAKIFFKPKKLDEKGAKVEFRPLHTAGLIELICMASLLIPLMFEDTTSGRKLSSISRLLPANFYGNIPSTKVEQLFKPWARQYKEYSDNAIAAGKNYKNNPKYKFEVTLDLKKFFPTVDPDFIHNFILSKWPTNALEEDIKWLDVILHKLLYMKLDIPDELLSHYFKNEPNKFEDSYLNLGIPQGLPQAYFFGNLCMAIIAKETAKNIPGDAYYYVDDSIIYTNIPEKDINIEAIEQNIAEQIIIKKKLALAKSRPKKIYESYSIGFHELGRKSSHCNIKGDSSLFFLAKPASPLSFEINTALDEHEDISLLSKIDAILSVIERNLSEEKRESRKKLLERYKKFYTNRANFLKIMQSNEIYFNDAYIEKFVLKHGLKAPIENNVFFDRLNDDVFELEGAKIVHQLMGFKQQLDEFLSTVKQFELNCLQIKPINNLTDYLFFSKVFASQASITKEFSQQYYSLNQNPFLGCINYKHRIRNEDKIMLVQDLASNLKSLL